MSLIAEKWEEIKEIIKKEYDLTDISYNTWIKPLKFHSAEENMVTILIPSDQAHAVSYITNKYKNFFQVSISEMFDKEYQVSFLLEKDIEKDTETVEKHNVYNINNESANLNPKYNFDTFVVGEEYRQRLNSFMNLRLFEKAVSEFSGEEEDFPTWKVAFKRIGEFAKDERFLLAIDDFADLVFEDGTILKDFRNAFENEWRNSNILE